MRALYDLLPMRGLTGLMLLLTLLAMLLTVE